MTDKKTKTNTIIFTIAAGLCNIVLTLLLLCVLFVAAAFLLYRVFHCTTSLPIQIAMPVIIVASIILDFILSVRIPRVIIKKFNLQEKINPKLADQYLYDKKHPNPNDPRLR